MAADSLFVRTPYPADDPAIGLVHNLETEFLVKKIKRERKYKRYVITIEGLKYGRTYRVYSAEPELKDQYRNFEKIKKGQKYRMSIGVLFPPLLNGHWLTFFSPHYKTELENGEIYNYGTGPRYHCPNLVGLYYITSDTTAVDASVKLGN